MGVRSIDFASVSTIFRLDFETVPTVWYYFLNLFPFIIYNFSILSTVSVFGPLLTLFFSSFFLLSRILHLESGLVAYLSLLQKSDLTGLKLFRQYGIIDFCKTQIDIQS
jgi:predicted membrane metal-binding protein